MFSNFDFDFIGGAAFLGVFPNFTILKNIFT